MFNAEILEPLTATASQSTVIAAAIESEAIATASQSTVVVAILESEAAVDSRPAITASKIPSAINSPVLATIGSTPTATAEWGPVPSSPGTYLVAGIPALVEYVAIAAPPARAQVLRAEIEAALVATIARSSHSEPQPITLPRTPAAINTPLVAAIGSNPALTVEWTTILGSPGTYITMGVPAWFDDALIATASQTTVLPAAIEDGLVARASQQAVVQALIQTAPGPATRLPITFPKLPATINGPLLAAIDSTPSATVEWSPEPSATGTFSVTGLSALLEDGALMGQDRAPVISATAIATIAEDVYQVTFEVFAPGDPLQSVSYRIYKATRDAPPWVIVEDLGSSAFSATLTVAATVYDGVIAEILATDIAGTTASLTRSLAAVVLPPPPPDITPPTAPPFLYVFELPDATWLFVWGQSTDDFAVDHYQIDQVDPVGDLITNLASGVKETYYIWAGGAAGNSYRVLAYDLAGNVSPSSPIARAVATVFPDIEITEVIAEQLPGTDTILVAWAVTPPGTPCTATIVDALEHAVGDPVVSATGQATLTVPATVSAGLFRVKVTASA